MVLLANFPYSVAAYPHTSVIFPIIAVPIVSSFRSFSKSEIPLFRGHRFQSKEQEYYGNVRKYICDGRRRIVNLTGDSTIPYLCVGQENALNLPFYDHRTLVNINKEEATRILVGDFKSNEVVVTDSEPPLNSKIMLKRIGTVERPSTIRWLKAGPVDVFQVEGKSTGE